MAKKKEGSAPKETASAEQPTTNISTTADTFKEETKQEEVVVGRNFTGGDVKETHTLKSRLVFEPMQGTHKVVWSKE